MSAGSGDAERPTAGAQADFTATVVDEWVRCGVTDAVVCPGSRSAPLATALADHAGLRVHVRLDERSAGFFAIGLSLGTGAPTVVCTTSGTAAAELHPAVVEAHHAHVPLLVCTADRPPELQQFGAPQSIDQHHLYGRAARWFSAPGVPDHPARRIWRSLASRAFAEATWSSAGPGPVHLNFAFREPLHGPPGSAAVGDPLGRPVHRVHRESFTPVPLPPEWWARRGVIVAGAGCGPAAGVLELARRTGWPVLADPRSRCRVPSVVGGPVVVGATDAILRAPDAGASLRPEAILVLGDPPTSKVWAAFAAGAAAVEGGAGHAPAAEVAVVDPSWSWRDPDRITGYHIAADPSSWIPAAVAHLEACGPRSSDQGWAERWASAEAAAQAAIDASLTAEPTLTEPAVARALLGAVPKGTRVVISSSMPVRDLEWYAPAIDAPPAVYANRGANGIDGVSSTALGLAATGHGPVVAVMGDLAFLHDASALVRSAPGPATPTTSPCTLVVLDNAGGGIFSFLPHATTVPADQFESLFGTPQATQVTDVARGFGLPVAEVSTEEELRAALTLEQTAPLRVVRVVLPDRGENVAVHDRIHEAVCGAVRTALAH